MISVCIATYNGERFIKEQLDSILCQIGPNDEVIVSDDHSTDGTRRVIESLKDKRVAFLVNEHVPGVTGNFENALLHARGDCIFLSDQDDVWMPNKVAVMTKWLESYPYVVSDCLVTDMLLNVVSETRYTLQSGITKNKYLAFLKSTPYQGSCAAFRREVLSKAIPFPKNIQSHDRWIGFVAAFYFSVGFCPEKLMYYRRHSQTVSTATEGHSPNSILSRIRNRFLYAKALFGIRNR